jgi:ring-1,2-phenylacetyl-CoA epoxidase subunit PaaA
VPDPRLRKDEQTGRWHYSEPDWEELKRVVTGHGPRSADRLEFRRIAREETSWVRDVMFAEAA